MGGGGTAASGQPGGRWRLRGVIDGRSERGHIPAGPVIGE